MPLFKPGEVTDGERANLVTVRDGILEFLRGPVGRAMRDNEGSFKRTYGELVTCYIGAVTVLTALEADDILSASDGPGRDAGGGEQASSGLPDAEQS